MNLHLKDTGDLIPELPMVLTVALLFPALPPEPHGPFIRLCSQITFVAVFSCPWWEQTPTLFHLAPVPLLSLCFPPRMPPSFLFIKIFFHFWGPAQSQPSSGTFYLYPGTLRATCRKLAAITSQQLMKRCAKLLYPGLSPRSIPPRSVVLGEQLNLWTPNFLYCRMRRIMLCIPVYWGFSEIMLSLAFD